MLGIVLAIAAAACWGAGAIFARSGLQGMKVLTGTFISMVSSVLLVGSLALIINFDAFVHLSLTAWLWFGMIGILSYLLGRLFNYASIMYIGASKATVLMASAPLFAIILAVTLIGESANIPIIVGTLSVVGGIYLVVSSG